MEEKVRQKMTTQKEQMMEEMEVGVAELYTSSFQRFENIDVIPIELYEGWTLMEEYPSHSEPLFNRLMQNKFRMTLIQDGLKIIDGYKNGVISACSGVREDDDDCRIIEKWSSFGFGSTIYKSHEAEGEGECDLNSGTGSGERQPPLSHSHIRTVEESSEITHLEENEIKAGKRKNREEITEEELNKNNIFCYHCNSEVSALQFGSHAGYGSHCKPYLNIYTSNGVSLHELSVTMSKIRKLSCNDIDDLCNYYQEFGDLLCCDMCPRAVHQGESLVEVFWAVFREKTASTLASLSLSETTKEETQSLLEKAQKERQSLLEKAINIFHEGEGEGECDLNSGSGERQPLLSHSHINTVEEETRESSDITHLEEEEIKAKKRKLEEITMQVIKK